MRNLPEALPLPDCSPAPGAAWYHSLCYYVAPQPTSQGPWAVLQLWFPEPMVRRALLLKAERGRVTEDMGQLGAGFFPPCG